MKELYFTLKDACALYSRCFVLLFGSTWRKEDLLRSMVQIGVNSLPIITISTAFAGMVVTDEMAWHMRSALQNISIIPGLTGQFILRELGIAIPALLLVSKVGASMTAEVGSMKITDQIDALRVMKIDPVAYYVFPRWVASTICTVCLTLIAILVTLIFSMMVANFKYGFGMLEYLTIFRHFVHASDIWCALVKSAVFGSVIPILACAHGFRCQGGAQGVGSATTQAVVVSTLSIIFLDLILTYLFTLVI